MLARTIAWTRRRRPASEAITGGMVGDIFPQPYADPFARQGAHLPENDDRHRSPRRRHDVHGDGLHVNPLILGFGGVPGLEGKGLPFAPTLTVTCLSAGLLSIAMGVFAKYPLALAPGMGLNAVVAFELVAGRGLTWPQAMTVVLCEGLAITILVLTRFREAMMTAVPYGRKRPSGMGIGLFIAFI